MWMCFQCGNLGDIHAERPPTGNAANILGLYIACTNVTFDRTISTKLCHANNVRLRIMAYAYICSDQQQTRQHTVAILRNDVVSACAKKTLYHINVHLYANPA